MNYLDVFVPVDPSAAINDSKFEKEFSSVAHSSYEWEQMYCSFVRSGDVEGAHNFMNSLLSGSESIFVGNVAKSRVTLTKYLGVSLIAVVTRVAINSGADEFTCYRSSDECIQFIDTCDDAEQLAVNIFASAEKMICAVRDAKQGMENNLYFKRCREYIINHLGEKITVDDLARLCNLTPNYMSHIFKVIAGKTITEYILEIRIRTATRLLLTDKYTTSEIASFLGFSSQSYFISCFKKQIGKTPRAWRMSQTRSKSEALYSEI